MVERGETRPPAPADDGFVVRPISVSPGRRPPILGVGLALAVVSLVVVGGLNAASDRDASPRGSFEAAVATGHPSPRPTLDPDRTPPPGPPTSRWTPGPRTPPPEVIDIELRAAGSHLFVHGDVFSLEVDVVVLTLEDGAGNTGESVAVRLDGGSTAFRLGANDRFDVMFDIADEVIADGLWVRAEAYDRGGMPLAKLRRPVIPPRNAVFGYGFR
jgi:hypothetical protein